MFSLLIVLVCGLSAEPLAAQTAGVEQLSLAFREVVKKVRPAVVYIAVEQGRQEPTAGSGVVIDGKNGYVLTANHVVRDASEVKVRLADGREFVANDIRTDPTIDIAVVKINGSDLPQAKLGDSDKLEVGDWVLAIGSPLGRILENSVSAGIVSAKGRRTGILLGQAGIEDFIQTDAVINKGNSGGPLVNIEGEVVGINSNIISATGMYAGLGFAVPSNLIKPTVQQLIQEGKVVRGWLGVTIASLKDLDKAELEQLPQELRTRGGAKVQSVLPDGPAQRAGLKEGDIILEVDGRAISDSPAVIEIVSAKRPGTKTKCLVWRKGEEKSVEVELGERPTELTREQLGLDTGPEAQSQAYSKLGLVVADFKASVLGVEGLSELKAVVVEYVRPGSLADEYGISPADVITEVQDQKVQSIAEFEKSIRQADTRKGVKLTLLGFFGEYKVVLKEGAD
jgi:serine protease Do